MALDLQDHLVLEAELVLLEAEVLLVPQEEWAQPDLQDLEEELDPLVVRGPSDLREDLAGLELLDLVVEQDGREPPEIMGDLVIRDLLVHLAAEDALEQLVTNQTSPNYKHILRVIPL